MKVVALLLCGLHISMTLTELKTALSPLINDYKITGIHGVGVSDNHVTVYYEKRGPGTQEAAFQYAKMLGGESVKFVESDMADLCTVVM
jgi:hypothetical protein